MCAVGSRRRLLRRILGCCTPMCTCRLQSRRCGTLGMDRHGKCTGAGWEACHNCLRLELGNVPEILLQVSYLSAVCLKVQRFMKLLVLTIAISTPGRGSKGHIVTHNVVGLQPSRALQLEKNGKPEADIKYLRSIKTCQDMIPESYGIFGAAVHQRNSSCMTMRKHCIS